MTYVAYATGRSFAGKVTILWDWIRQARKSLSADLAILMLSGNEYMKDKSFCIMEYTTSSILPKFTSFLQTRHQFFAPFHETVGVSKEKEVGDV